jgi:hypothetical protein
MKFVSSFHGTRASLLFLIALTAAAPLRAGAVDPARVHFHIDLEKNVQPISPFIYGVNQKLEGALSHATLRRVGGNRYSAFNWVNNASNAGSDFHYQNDGFLGGGDEPGGALLEAMQNTAAANAALLLQIPMTGYVAADKNGAGDVRKSGARYLHKRFRVEMPVKDKPFDLRPDPDSPIVYEDEFVNWVKSRCPWALTDPRRPVFFSLDNEPDLWQTTHAEVHWAHVTYAEVVAKGIEYSAAIKRVMPTAKIFGPVNYGWNGFETLEGAPDANGRDFQEFYLDQMAAAETKSGRRLLDVMDVHWYPEATGDNGMRITLPDSSAQTVEARVQTPRSLWDPTYTEKSWITQSGTKGPIALLPRLSSKISHHYPGTALGISEYNFGGGQDISGGIAEADVLGIFGKFGLFAACEWPLQADEPFIDAAFEMYRDFDGQDGAFGDISVAATSDNAAAGSIYASLHHDHAGWITLVAINKTDRDLPADFTIEPGRSLTEAAIYQLTAARPAPIPSGVIKMNVPGQFSYTMPPMSVTTLRLRSAAKEP